MWIPGGALPKGRLPGWPSGEGGIQGVLRGPRPPQRPAEQGRAAASTATEQERHGRGGRGDARLLLHAWLHKGPADIDEQIPSNRCVIDGRMTCLLPRPGREAPRSTLFGKGTSPVDPYPPYSKEPEAIRKPWAANSRRPILKPRE